VRLVGPGTDLTMSIKDRTSIVDDGVHNMPGGEVFTAPIEGSVEGDVYFDLPAIAYGKEVMEIRLRFEGGEIVDLSAGKNEALLRSMVDTDRGSRKLGELGVGMNRRIDRFTKNILFDEKIGNTIHLAIGRAYRECGGTNESAIHWDMIKTMEPGRIVVDGEAVYRDGRFRWE
ncbi:MAG: aminopeptidase, partial [Candidatus Bathyarchaeia archaeon]